MIKFSEKNQAFYDSNLKYSDLPDDLVTISAEQHQIMLDQINGSCIIFSNLTASPPRPNQFHTWNGTDWIDHRTTEEIEAQRLKQFKPLTRYQFFRALLESGYKSADIEVQIQTIEDDYQRELVMLGWQMATNFVRTDESVLLMQNMLGWTRDQVDEMWFYASTL
ncbi:hypothetical protein [Acinetobacter sp. ANC 4173]|uniref:hypothetical protein n=1 Tax=Acinetobacter sp. ANC 4173 TaxID=2529837 RepID=UPI00103CC920|nr:hypothetical protein [Acinetobacter sp. ANC 4173]TCB81653.1 hypothetical protein E0H94_03800 [Acinetobacter sp. ANC 4173]